MKFTLLSYLTCCRFHVKQECERVIQQLQNQISALQQDHVIAEDTIQRKDSLLMQAQQQWKTIEVDWNQRLALANEEKERLLAVSFVLLLLKYPICYATS